MNVDTELVKINHKLVEASPDDYNSSHHSAEEVGLNLEIPSEAPYAYSRWISLIQRSQNVSLTDPQGVQRIFLSPRQGRLLVEASNASIHTRQLNRMYTEDLHDVIAPSLSSLNFGDGLFLRLDACSPKDGAPGNFALKGVDDVLLRITTSLRARNSIQVLLDANAESINLWFLPFNTNMKTELEYRVFCPPHHCEISAISQYRWHKQSVFRDRSEEELGKIVRKIKDEAIRIHGEIMAEVEHRLKNMSSSTDGMGELMLKQGFSFDIIFDEAAQRCALIELNVFGARSGCGACLFHWLRDMNVLYGRTGKGIEFRISV